MRTLVTKPRPEKASSIRVRPEYGLRQTVKKSERGVVSYHIYGSSGKVDDGSFTGRKLVEAIQDGLPVTDLAVLQESLNVSTEKLAPMLGISKATFHRRRGAGKKLGAAESDRVVRFARLLGKAIKVFGAEEDARVWLSSPQFGLGGAVPLDFSKTEVGAREVENLLGRIEHGVYS